MILPLSTCLPARLLAVLCYAWEGRGGSAEEGFRDEWVNFPAERAVAKLTDVGIRGSDAIAIISLTSYN